MSDTTTPAELEIPQAAVDEWFHCGCEQGCSRSGYQPDALPVIVAAELRRHAQETRAGAIELDELGMLSTSEQNVYARVIQALRARADELDGGLS